MDIRQQLQRLLDLTDEARRHTQELGASRAGAEAELDAAEYDLKRLIAEIRSLLPEGELPAAAEPNADPVRRTG